MNGSNRVMKVWSAIAGVALLVIVGWCVHQALRRHVVEVKPDRQFRDFYEFYCAADALAKGGGAKEVFAAGEQGYVYPPMLAAGLTLLVPLGIKGAAEVWIGLNGLELLGAVLLAGTVSARLFTGRAAGKSVDWKWWILPLGVGGCLLLVDKVHSDIKLQESNQLMSLSWCVAGACVLLGSKREGWRRVAAGVAMGVAFNIKYVIGAAMPYLLVRGAWRTVLWGVAWCGTLALAPAILIGWQRNADLWRGAIQGLLHAGGAEKVSAEGMARVMPMQTFGLSVTSSMLEIGAAMGSEKIGLLLAGVAALAVLAVVWWLYRRAGVSLMGWRALGPGVEPDDRSRRLLAMEWAGIIVGMLAFSPHTNMLQMVQAMISMTIMLGAATMLALEAKAHGRRGIMRAAMAYLGLAVVVLGLVLPIASMSTREAAREWARTGGPAWCLVAGWLMVLWAVLEAEWVSRQAPGCHGLGA